MKYLYEYKEKNGSMVGGHNLENIYFEDNVIILEGTDYMRVDYQTRSLHWRDLLNSKEIEYLKIMPMVDEDQNNDYL